VFEAHGHIVYKYLLRLSHDELIAEELTQETFYQVMKSIHRYDKSCLITTWMCQIAKNLWYQELDKQRKRPQVLSDEMILTDTMDIEKNYIEKEAAKELLMIIQTLAEEEQLLVLWRCVDELPFKTIGEMLGKTENWSRVTFFRVKKKLRRKSYE
jgi:RNA polymerase sigma-70 factor (ECF subfamily)